MAHACCTSTGFARRLPSRLVHGLQQQHRLHPVFTGPVPAGFRRGWLLILWAQPDRARSGQLTMPGVPRRQVHAGQPAYALRQLYARQARHRVRARDPVCAVCPRPVRHRIHGASHQSAGRQSLSSVQRGAVSALLRRNKLCSVPHGEVERARAALVHRLPRGALPGRQQHGLRRPSTTTSTCGVRSARGVQRTN